MILRALKYAQLVGRALVDQFGALESEEVDKLTETLYSVPQKVIFAVLTPYQEHCEEIVQNLYSFAQKNMLGERFTKEKIRALFSSAGIMLALNIMNDIAYNAANENTITVLRERPNQNLNYRIFELMLEENTGNTSEFVQRAIALRKDLDNSPFSVMLISQIARKHIIYNGNINHRELNRLLSGNVLSSEKKTSLLLTQGTGIVNQ